MEIVVSNKASRPLYEQIASQIKAAIMSGELKAGEAIPSVRSLAKSLHISILTVQKAYATLQEDGFIETTAGKGCYVSAQNQDFYLEEQQKYQAVENTIRHSTDGQKEQLAQLRAYAKAWQKRCQKRMTVLDDRIVQGRKRNGKSSAKAG